MRALWVDAGNDPDWEKIAAHKMTALYFPVSDPGDDVGRRCAEAKAKGYSPGVYMAANWEPFDKLSGNDQAELMHTLVAAIETKAKTKVRVQFNNEEHNPPEIGSCLVRWRALRPMADTSWAFEGMQGGWMDDAFVLAVVRARVRVVPEAYGGKDGRMDYLIDTLALARNLVQVGFPLPLISPFYDAAALPEYWDGFAFTMGRLP